MVQPRWVLAATRRHPRLGSFCPQTRLQRSARVQQVQAVDVGHGIEARPLLLLLLLGADRRRCRRRDGRHPRADAGQLQAAAVAAPLHRPARALVAQNQRRDVAKPSGLQAVRARLAAVRPAADGQARGRVSRAVREVRRQQLPHLCRHRPASAAQGVGVWGCEAGAESARERRRGRGEFQRYPRLTLRTGSSRAAPAGGPAGCTVASIGWTPHSSAAAARGSGEAGRPRLLPGRRGWRQGRRRKPAGTERRRAWRLQR